MYMINFGFWDSAGGQFFLSQRIYTKNGKWTPFIKIKKRYCKHGKGKTDYCLPCNRVNSN